MKKIKYIRRPLKAAADVYVGLVLAFLISLAVASCNVTRVMTHESMYVEHGDTAAIITTRTIETYDATKKGAANNNH